MQDKLQSLAEQTRELRAQARRLVAEHKAARTKLRRTVADVERVAQSLPVGDITPRRKLSQ
jgi:hypothetical protein